MHSIPGDEARSGADARERTTAGCARGLCRSRLATLLAALLVPAFAPAAASAAPPTPAPACTHAVVNPEVETVACALPGGPRRYRLDVHFVGSHDDTDLSIAAALDGRPYACAPGSKTSLFAADGNVALHCLVDTGDAVGQDRQLELTLTIKHAQYESFDLTLE